MDSDTIVMDRIQNKNYDLVFSGLVKNIKPSARQLETLNRMLDTDVKLTKRADNNLSLAISSPGGAATRSDEPIVKSSNQTEQSLSSSENHFSLLIVALCSGAVLLFVILAAMVFYRVKNKNA